MIKRTIFFTLMILNIGISIAAAADWDCTTFTLSLDNPVVSKGDYALNVIEFDGYGMVRINVSCRGEFVESTALSNNDSNWCYMDNDKIRLKGVNVTDQRVLPLFGSIYSPQAEILFATDKSPDDSESLALSISTDKDEYWLDETITATVKIRNVGEVRVEDIHLSIDSDGLLMQENLPTNFSLEDGTYRSEDIKFGFPALLSKGFYNISLKVNWKDAHGTQRFIEESTTVQVTEPLEIWKCTTHEAKQGIPVYASINVENVQTRPVMVRLTDALPMCFTLIDGTVTDNKSDLNWEFILAPGERKVCSYQMSTEQIGAHRVPEVHATWNLWGEDYINSSESDNIIDVYRGVSYRERDFSHSPELSDTVVFFTETSNGSSPKVTLEVHILPAISIEVTPYSLNFGELAPGDVSDISNVSITNNGTGSIHVTASVTDETGDLYKQGLIIDGNSWRDFNETISNNIVVKIEVELEVPETYEGLGSKNGTLMFWAEEKN
jgi:hypothetical protein